MLFLYGKVILQIECKLLGGELIVNDFVLHVTEEWFLKDIPSIEEYLLDGPDRFWRILKENL
jgi:hypothetical protein